MAKEKSVKKYENNWNKGEIQKEKSKKEKKKKKVAEKARLIKKTNLYTFKQIFVVLFSFIAMPCNGQPLHATFVSKTVQFIQFGKKVSNLFI